MNCCHGSHWGLGWSIVVMKKDSSGEHSCFCFLWLLLRGISVAENNTAPSWCDPFQGNQSARYLENPKSRLKRWPWSSLRWDMCTSTALIALWFRIAGMSPTFVHSNEMSKKILFTGFKQFQKASEQSASGVFLFGNQKAMDPPYGKLWESKVFFFFSQCCLVFQLRCSIFQLSEQSASGVFLFRSQKAMDLSYGKLRESKVFFSQCYLLFQLRCSVSQSFEDMILSNLALSCQEQGLSCPWSLQLECLLGLGSFSTFALPSLNSFA